MKRAKYKCKNINEYKRLRKCTHPDCDEYGIISYRNDTDETPVHVEYRCIPHVHWIKEPTVVSEAKKPNLYKRLDDIDKLLSLAAYHTRKVEVS